MKNKLSSDKQTILYKELKCGMDKCTNIILTKNNKPTKHTNESNPDFCKDCVCDHSYNSDGECAYCGES